MRRIIMFIVFVTFLYLLFFQEKGNQEFSITGFTMGNITYNVKYISSKKISKQNRNRLNLNKI